MLLLKIPVLSEGEGMALPLSERIKGKRKPREGCGIQQSSELAIPPGKMYTFLMVNIINIWNSTGRDWVTSLSLSAGLGKAHVHL